MNTPRGVKYGDMVEVIINAKSTKDMLLTDSITITTIAKPAILAIKTSIGHEKNVADAPVDAFASRLELERSDPLRVGAGLLGDPLFHLRQRNLVIHGASWNHTMRATQLPCWPKP